jgi:RNA polymerase sigma-70 factor (ECF subfamily)
MLSFEQTMLPHLDAAYNLARWLVRDEHDAQDATQDAYVRAYRFFGSYRGGNPRAWLLKIVRNACLDRIRQNHADAQNQPLDEMLHDVASELDDPQALAVKQNDIAMVRAAIERLPTEFREILLLREMENLSYKEIADIAHLPIGTVMSRLARARQRLAGILSDPLSMEAANDL